MTQTYDLIVRGGEVVNHAGRGLADVGVRDGKIAAIGDLGQASAGEVFDATGLTVLPGVIDTQVHFREPGLEWKEDLETGSPRGGAGRRRRRVRDAEHRAHHHRPATPWPTSWPAPRDRMHCDHAFYVGGTHENAAHPGRAGAAARLLRGQGVHGRLDRHPAGRRRRRASSRCCATSTAAPPSTPRTNTAWPSAARWPATGDWTSHPEVRDAESGHPVDRPPGPASPASWASASTCCTSPPPRRSTSWPTTRTSPRSRSRPST